MSLSAREKSNLEDLFSHVKESNHLLITNSMFKEQILQYQYYIKILKEFFFFFNDNKEIIENNIEKNKELNFEFKN